MSEDIQEKVIKDVGIFGLKTLLALNSGAAIVLLAFVGNVYGQTEPTLALDLGRLKWAMGCFLAGIAFAMGSVAVTYVLAQLQNARRNATTHLSIGGFLAWMVGPAVASFLCFAGGYIFAIGALR